VHDPIALSQLQSLTWHLKPPTQELWLHLGCCFLHVCKCPQTTKQWNTTNDHWIRNTITVHA